jgi:dolichyl-phosphate-mannose-protein mannosyltransferase
MNIDFIKRWTETQWLIVILLVASFVTHFIWLGYPDQVVFDEVHFGKFVTAYCCTHETFFDIHPPHAKLLIAGTAYLFGYRGGMTFEHISQSYGSVATLPLRLFPAIMGFLFPLLIYVLLRQLKASPPAAFLGAALVILENSLTVQTRIIALDGMLLVTIIGSVVTYLAAKKRERVTWALVRSGTRKLSKWHSLMGGINLKKEGWLFVLSGASIGLAVGTKFTGLLAAGLVFSLFVAWLLQIKNYLEIRRVLASALLVAVGAIFVYLLGWMIHFMILTEPGTGELWRVPEWNQPIMISFLKETKEIHRIMYEANSGLNAEHHDGSPWWSWPLLRTPVFYWQQSIDIGENSKEGAIYFLGNPLLWWGATVFLMIIFLSILITGITWLTSLRPPDLRPTKLWLKVHSGWRDSFLERAWVPLIGYIASYVPLMAVTRVLFLYHYLMPFLFSLIVTVLWLDYVKLIKPVSIFKQTKTYWVIFGIVGLSFLFFTPLTYGFLLPSEIRHLWFWFDTWH